jgi:hypothetical protein
MREMLVDYNDICFENFTLKMEIETLSDDALLDECNHILASVRKNNDMDIILKNYFKTGKITKQERQKAESLYLLAYGDFGWDV